MLESESEIGIDVNLPFGLNQHVSFLPTSGWEIVQPEIPEETLSKDYVDVFVTSDAERKVNDIKNEYPKVLSELQKTELEDRIAETLGLDYPGLLDQHRTAQVELDNQPWPLIFDPVKDLMFRQIRTGYLGQPIVVYKIKTMPSGTTSRETRGLQGFDIHGKPVGEGENLHLIYRILRKTGIDEIPQLIYNVPRGEMKPFAASRARPFGEILRDAPPSQMEHEVLEIPGVLCGSYGDIRMPYEGPVGKILEKIGENLVAKTKLDADKVLPRFKGEPEQFRYDAAQAMRTEMELSNVPLIVNAKWQLWGMYGMTVKKHF